MKKIISILTFVLIIACLAVAANAAVGKVVYATKVDKAPNMEEDSAFIDESWGEPAIIINSSTPNTNLVAYWREENDQKDKSDWEANKAYLEQLEPEDGDIELYYLWDSKYFYFGMKTPDTHPSGAVQYWMGDGFMFWLSPLAGIPLDAPLEKLMAHYNSNTTLYSYIATLDTSDWDHVAEAAAKNCDSELFVADDGYMYAYVRIPLMNIGLNPKTNLHGMEMGHVFQRISSVSVEDFGYAGWLYWGGFEAHHLNTVVFVDPAQGELQIEVETFAPETEEPAVETDAPETEAPVVETDAPETEAPVVETDVPETEAPVVETDAPETEAPVVETDAPETEAPVVETDAPETEAPVVETDAPATEAPVVETDAPETEAPVVETDAPETDAPVVETDAPETDAPIAPETNAPAAPAEPAKKGNTGIIIGIVAAVVVVGAVVGIVFGKKKK